MPDISKDAARRIAQKIKAGLAKDSKLTDRQVCEDVLEIIGVPTHTREEVCRDTFGN